MGLNEPLTETKIKITLFNLLHYNVNWLLVNSPLLWFSVAEWRDIPLSGAAAQCLYRFISELGTTESGKLDPWIIIDRCHVMPRQKALI